MPKISYINGKFVDHKDTSVSIEDRGYQFSDGVYEVVYVRDSALIDWQAHCDRLKNSLDGLKIDYQVSPDALRDIIRELLKRNELTNAALYLQITRGVAKRDHQFPTDAVSPSVIMTVGEAKFPSKAQYETGVKTITCPDQRWKRRDLKTISLLPNTLAKQAAVEQGAAEAILVEDDGYITEGSSTNFFIVDKEGVLRTHPTTQRILGGITRMGVLKVARNNGIAVKEEAFTPEEALNAKEAFITSTTKHILPVVELDGNVIGSGKPGAITKRLMSLYEEFVAKQVI